MNFGFVRYELREDAAEPKRVFAKGRAHPVAAGRRGVAFVEHEIDDLEHGAEALRELLTSRHFERGAGFRERLLRTHDALCGGRLRNHERARNLFRGEATEY